MRLRTSRDSRGNIWVHGPAFIAWARETITQKKSKRQGLPDGQAWCIRCNHPVALIDPRIRPVNRYLELITARCPECGATINRGRAK